MAKILQTLVLSMLPYQPMRVLGTPSLEHSVTTLLMCYVAELELTSSSVHINTYALPQAIVIDGSSTEEDFFTKAMRKEADKLKLTLVEVPRDGAKKLGWITKLDGAALSGMKQCDSLLGPSANITGSME